MKMFGINYSVYKMIVIFFKKLIILLKLVVVLSAD